MSSQPPVPPGYTPSERWARILPQRPRLLRLARRLSLNAYDAEDCVQEALLRAVAVEPFDPARIEGWLVTVVRRLAVDQHRERGRMRLAGTKVAMGELALTAPDEDVLDRAEARWLEVRVRGLSGREREVIQRRAEGLSPAEAAAVMGVSGKAANSAFTRARRTLTATWRTTLGWLGLDRLRPRRQLAVVVVAAPAVLALALWVQGPAHHGERNAPQAAGVEAITSGDHTSGPRRVVPSRAGRAETVRRSTETRLVDQKVGSDAVVSGGVVVTRRHEEETLEQTLARCLQKGVAVSTSHIGCRD